MKKIITLLSVMLPLYTSAQVSFNFENGTAEGWIYNAPDRWKADILNPLNGMYSLHHLFDNSEASTDVAVFSIAGLCPACSDITWEFTLRHGADPSSSNKWAFILASDTGPDGIMTGTGFNGFTAGVNFTGYDDTLRLWQVSAGKTNVLITTDINWQNDIGINSAVTIRVTRSEGGEWSMDAESQMSKVESWMEKGESQLPKAESRKSKIENGQEWRWAGISYTYTSTRDRLLWIDDVSIDGVFIPDTLPPEVVSVTALSSDILRVVFDEDPAPSSLLISDISITGGAQVVSVTRVYPNVYELLLNSELSNRTRYLLKFGLLCDPYGNCASSVTEDFIPVYAVTGDVVITEIMADPSPPVQLPDEEFLEFTNLTSDSLSLKDWILIGDDDTSRFPEVWIKGGEQVILCSPSEAPGFSVYGRAIGLAGFPLLNDGGETLALRDSRGRLIHTATYSKLFYKDEWRTGGGWSMEMTDPENPFNAPDIWRASGDPSGGTPGRPNSAIITAPDSRCPEVIAVYPVGSMKARIVFDETIMGVTNPEEWTLDGVGAVSAVSDDIADRAFVITGPELFAPGRIYTLQIPSSAADYSGMSACQPAVRFGVPELPFPGDLLFNELLFDPPPACSDYIELYNNSDRIIDLSQLFLTGSAPEENSSMRKGPGIFSGYSNSPVTSVSQVPRQLLPREYVAVTTGRNEVTASYSCSEKKSVHEVVSLPSMPDDQGTLILLDRSLNILDRVDYSGSMHMAFLGNTEGIALEKAGPELPSGSSDNWHSATEACGWGTPGAINSVLAVHSGQAPGLSLSSERISPDGDGFEDVITARVLPGGSDNVITVTVFNARGYAVRRLAQRYFAGEEALIIWDGTGDEGNRLNSGLYMIMAESYNSRGQTQRWERVCALLYR